MKHYAFAQTFGSLYDKALGLYSKGQRGAETYFTPEETAWLGSVGLTAQNLYDYAEDDVASGEPGYDNALLIEGIRRDYFGSCRRPRRSFGASCPPRSCTAAAVTVASSRSTTFFPPNS